MRCPIPIIEISKIIKKMKSGETLAVSADDPAFCDDVKAWCEMTGNSLVSIDKSEEKCRAIIKKL